MKRCDRQVGMVMPFLLKLLVTNLIIIGCARLANRSPSLAGLIATMPLTSLLVLLWLHVDHRGDYPLLDSYTRGVLWGIIPTTLFFLALSLCFRKHLPLPFALSVAFTVWLAGAAVHQWMAGR